MIEPKQRPKAFVSMLFGLAAGGLGVSQLVGAATRGVIDSGGRHSHLVTAAGQPSAFWLSVLLCSIGVFVLGGSSLLLLIALFTREKPVKLRSLAHEDRFDRGVRASRDPAA